MIFSTKKVAKYRINTCSALDSSALLIAIDNINTVCEIVLYVSCWRSGYMCLAGAVVIVADSGPLTQRFRVQYGGLLYRPMKKKVKGEGWLTGLSRYMNDKKIVIKWNLTPLHIV